MLKKIISLFLVCLLPLTAFGETLRPVVLEWRNAFWNGGGTYPQIHADVEIPGRYYLVSDVAGMWYSENYGNQWKWMNNGTTSVGNTTTVINSAFIQSVKNPALMYVLGTEYLVRSKDRGRNWKQVGSFKGVKPFKQLAVDPNDSKIVYVAQRNGKISRSIDEGTTFQDLITPFGTNVYATFLYVDKTSTYLFAGSLNSGILRYKISDGTYTIITLAGPNATRNFDFSAYTDLSGVEHICTGAGLSIACTVDLGDNWSYTATITSDTQFFISVLSARQLANGQVFYLAHGRRVSTQYGENIDVHSSDSGASWVSHYNNVTQDTSIRGPYITFDVIGNVYNYLADPFDETKYFVTTDGWVFRSDNSAVDWTERTVGAMNVVLSDVKVAPNGWWFVCGMDIGLSYSTDKGVTWHEAIPHLPLDGPQGFGIAGHYWRIEFPGFGGDTKEEWEANREAAWDAGDGVVLVTASMYINAPVYVPTVWRSDQNGTGNWVNSSTGLPTTALTGSAAPHRAVWGIGYPRALACHPNGSTCYLGVDGYSSTENGGIFISRNQGQTWSRMTQPEHWQVYNAISVDPTDVTGNTAVFADSFISGGTPHFWKTTDGLTWNQSDVANYGIFDVTYNSVGNLFATGLYTNPQVYYSTNGNPGTWNYMHALNSTDNIGDGLYSDPDDPNILYAGSNDGTSTGPGTGTKIGGSVYMTTNALSFANASWVEITGDLPSPSGIAALAVDKSVGPKGTLIAATENGLYTLDLNDRIVTELEDMVIE